MKPTTCNECFDLPTGQVRVAVARLLNGDIALCMECLKQMTDAAEYPCSEVIQLGVSSRERSEVFKENERLAATNRDGAAREQQLLDENTELRDSLFEWGEWAKAAACPEQEQPRQGPWRHDRCASQTDRRTAREDRNAARRVLLNSSLRLTT